MTEIKRRHSRLSCSSLLELSSWVFVWMGKAWLTCSVQAGGRRELPFQKANPEQGNFIYYHRSPCSVYSLTYRWYMLPCGGREVIEKQQQKKGTATSWQQPGILNHRHTDVKYTMYIECLIGITYKCGAIKSEYFTFLTPKSDVAYIWMSSRQTLENGTWKFSLHSTSQLDRKIKLFPRWSSLGMKTSPGLKEAERGISIIISTKRTCTKSSSRSTWRICWTKTITGMFRCDQGYFMSSPVRESLNTATKDWNIWKGFRFIKELPHCNFSIAIRQF